MKAVKREKRAAPTRFVTFSTSAARIVLALLVVILVVGLPQGTRRAPASTAVGGPSDSRFYQAVVARVKRGEPYDQAAITEQRARDYPLRPFIAVRPPILATMLSWAPNPIIPILVEWLLALGVVGAWVFRLRPVRPGPRLMSWTAFFVFTGVLVDMNGETSSVFHEAWAGLLIALSLALRTDKRFAAAVALVRELAMPYLLVMAMFAAAERRRREALAFAAALLASGVALAFHAQAVQALVTSRDPISPGWAALGGWRFVMAASNWNALGAALGLWSSAILLPLALIGSASWKDPAGLRLATLLVGYGLGFVFIGRPDNSYWGLVIAPLLGVGLALAPAALRDLWVRASSPRFARGVGPEPRGASQ